MLHDASLALVPSDNHTPRWFTAKQVAAETQHHAVVIRRWARAGRIEGAEKHGRSWRFDMMKFKVLSAPPVAEVERVGRAEQLDRDIEALMAA